MFWKGLKSWSCSPPGRAVQGFCEVYGLRVLVREAVDAVVTPRWVLGSGCVGMVFAFLLLP